MGDSEIHAELHAFADDLSLGQAKERSVDVEPIALDPGFRDALRAREEILRGLEEGEEAVRER